MIRAIFFDFDGTISDARKLIYDNIVALFKEEGYKFDKQELRKLLGAKMENILLGLRIDGDVNKLRDKFYKRMIEALDKSRLQLCVSVAPLKELSKDYPLIVISNARSDFTIKSAKRLGIINLFNELYGAESFKTKDELIKKLLKKYKFRPHEVIYVGDRFSDVDYARDAGCWAVAIHNKCSWSSKERVLKEKPDFIIKDFNGLKKVVEKINKN
jgi:HAD superfamily hydrolase (TIGR01549 family)